MMSYIDSTPLSTIFSLKNVSVATFLVVSMYLAWRRLYGKIKVNCWFCNTNCFVRYRMRNQWYCPNCHQYNGFTASGDYNSSVPGMHNENTNTSAANLGTPVKNDATFVDQPVHLCSKCARNQLLKVKQMSRFEPMREENFEQEAKAFEKKLDKLYSLCERCQDATNRHIKMQDTIIRGSMLSKKRLVMKQNGKSSDSNNNHSAIKLQHIYFSMTTVIWTVVLFSSLVHAFSVAISLLTTAFNPLSFIVKLPSPFWVDISNSVAICGVVCSFMATIFKGPSTHSVWCTALWSFHAFIVPWIKGVNYFQVITSPMTASLTEAVNGMHNSNSGSHFSPPPIAHFAVIVVVYLVSIVALIVSSGICLYQSSHQGQTQVHKTNPFAKPKGFIKSCKPPKSHADSCAIPQDNDTYSDCSMPSEDEAPIPCSKRQHLNENGTSSKDFGLNGSLLGLNLHDSSQQPAADLFRPPPSNGAFTSALHTPPPSRSSSLLSLSSHHSAQNYFTGNNFAAGPSQVQQPEFAKPYDSIPFSRYKSYTTVSGAPKHKFTGDAKSVASFPVSAWSNYSNKPSEAMLTSKRVNRPLISPAKLNWRSTNQRKRGFNSTNAFKESPFRSGTSPWEQKSQLDVSFHDSVSQTGENYRPELSDNEDDFMCQTPMKQTRNLPDDVDMNSSSPRSMISNLSSVTMKGIEEVENSRVCKWIMFFCLLLNLVLVALLIWDVKAMREAQSWKSGSSSL